MAIRQYVGARYVPKFSDPIEWEENRSYEALTIVTYNNDSYTSKIPVPANIGNPAENKNYWVITGNFNGQVNTLQENVGEFSNKIDGFEKTITEYTTKVNENEKLTNENKKSIDEINTKVGKENRKFLMFGDEWGSSVYETLKTIFGEENSRNFCVDNTGIENLSTEVNTAKNDDNVDLNKITDIYIMCGLHNVYENNNVRYADATTQFNSFSAFPNAKVHYFPNNSNTRNSGRNSRYGGFMNAAKASYICGHIETLAYPLQYSGNNYETETTLKANQYQNLARFMYWLAEGSATYEPFNYSFNMTGTNVTSDFADNGSGFNGDFLGNGIIDIAVRNVTLESAGDITVNLPTNLPFGYGTASGTRVLGIAESSSGIEYCTVTAGYSNENKFTIRGLNTGVEYQINALFNVRNIFDI